MERLPCVPFPPELARQMKILSEYKVFYNDVPLSVFARAFFRVWKILGGRLDAISFDYWFRHEVRNTH